MTRALLVVAPLIAIARGPLLGAANLVAAGRRAGHAVDLLDLNARWICEHIPEGALLEQRRFIGDHDRPEVFRVLRQQFLSALDLEPPARHMAEIHARAQALAASPFGRWAEAALIGSAQGRPPEVLGVSVMYDEQVLPALAITVIARRLSPRAVVIWGGPHVTAMRDEIVHDEAYGWQIDGFAFGYAESTWADALDAIGHERRLPPEIVRAGSGKVVMANEALNVLPDFGSLSAYDPARLTLPIQASRGCSYGICTFCTYPGVEGRASRRLDTATVRAAIEQAVTLGASLSFKDSLVDHDLLIELCHWIGGRVAWSACTKLTAQLPGLLAALARSGCHTLEIGLETLAHDAQVVARKKQPLANFLALLDAAQHSGIALVLNYITGFPKVEAADEQAARLLVLDALAARPRLTAALEHNRLQVERLAPLGRAPSTHGIEIVGERPWSSVLDWRPVPESAPHVQIGTQRRKSP